MWVGLQAPCTEFGNRFPYDTTLAEFDGSDQADQAYAQALNVGLDGTIIYYDLEIYDAAQPDCVAAVNAFLDGWISELHAFGFLAGVYGNPAPAATWWAGSTVPDDAWIAKYDARATLWGMGYGTTDDMWSPNKRIHQYSNTHFETWGTTRLDIDNDIFYADLVQGTGTKPYSFAIGDLAIGIAPIANGINTQCVGLCGMENGPAIDDIVGQDGAHSFIVSNQGSGELPDCEDSVWTWAWGINFAREIVGECAGPGGQFGFLISSGGSVGTIGGFTSAYGINDDHQIVGYVNDAQGTHGLIQANGLRMLDFGNGSSTTANGINGASQIVGTYYDSDGYAHGYLYTNWYPSGSGSFYTIDYPGANETYVQGINNNGQIVGWYYTDDWAVILGFFYDPQLGFVNIDHNNPDDITSWTVIDGINDTGKIVGAYVWCDDCNAKSIVGDPF